MECPHCGYMNGWHGGEMKVIEGEHGDFFRATNQIEMKRYAEVFGGESRPLLGCPACNKVFMGD